MTPTDIPFYASVCSAPAAYSSACYCLGVDPVTITTTTPIITVTVNEVVVMTPFEGMSIYFENLLMH
jgi:hypothetical protein